jgi:hypothetical protein
MKLNKLRRYGFAGDFFCDLTEGDFVYFEDLIPLQTLSELSVSCPVIFYFEGQTWDIGCYDGSTYKSLGGFEYTIKPILWSEILHH